MLKEIHKLAILIEAQVALYFKEVKNQTFGTLPNTGKEDQQHGYPGEPRSAEGEE